MDRILNIFKPKGISSFGVIRQIKKITGEKKVGHAGTLDPLAEGVLVVAIGRTATRKIGAIVDKEKEYLAKITLGQTSSTDDEEGEKIPIAVKSIPSLKSVQETMRKFHGKIMQRPPEYSAIKIKGRRAYEMARRGLKPKLKKRLVEIKSIEIIFYKWPRLDIDVVCGRGVYIRSLARDIGEELKCGGYLSNLKRTRVGEFIIDNSILAEKIKNRFNAN